MKSLGDIINMVKDGQKPEYEELRYAVCALEALHTFDSLSLMDLYKAEEKKKKPFLTSSAIWQYNESWNRAKIAFEKSPKDWVGWNNDPDNPEYQKRREGSIRLFEKIIKKTV